MFTFVQTCGACPEQYDVYMDDDLKTRVAYVRLRHGLFRVDCPPGGESVFAAEPPGADGIFVSDEQRQNYLALACHAILLKQASVPYVPFKVIYE